VPEGCDIRWRNTAFCLITPDCLRRRLAEAVLDRLLEAGYAPGGWRPVQIGGRQIDAVAEIQGIGAGKAFHYRALDSLFVLGESLAILLVDTRDRVPDNFYRALRALKGSTPEKSKIGSIRRDLGCINAVMSLLHISDSPENSARESAAILGAGPAAAWRETSQLGGYLSLLASTQPRESRDFSDVLTAVRGRLIAALWEDLPARGREMAAKLAGSGQLAEPEAGALIAAELPPGAAAHPLAAALARTFTPADSPTGTAAELGNVPLLLELHGCALDSWERAVLATSCYFEPVRPAADAV
jgi:nucleoside diphosphate kinase